MSRPKKLAKLTRFRPGWPLFGPPADCSLCLGPKSWRNWLDIEVFEARVAKFRTGSHAFRRMASILAKLTRFWSSNVRYRSFFDVWMTKSIRYRCVFDRNVADSTGYRCFFDRNVASERSRRLGRLLRAKFRIGSHFFR